MSHMIATNGALVKSNGFPLWVRYCHGLSILFDHPRFYLLPVDHLDKDQAAGEAIPEERLVPWLIVWFAW